MSTHSLTFSTPEMTLKKFAVWLGEQVNNTKGKEQIPRLMLYLEDKDKRGSNMQDSDLMPDVSDTFKPSGAVTDMFHEISSNNTDEQISPSLKTSAVKEAASEAKYCIECGSKLKLSSKFCLKCGTKQE